MRRPRLRYSLSCMMAIVAVLAVLMGAMKARERERTRQALGRARVTAALQCYNTHLSRWNAGITRFEDVYTWSRQILESQRDLDNSRTGRAAAAEAHRSRMEALQKAFTNGGCVRDSDVQAVDYYVKEATCWVVAEQ